MKILFKSKNYFCLLLVWAPLTCLGQTSRIDQQVDSMKRSFFHQDSVRRAGETRKLVKPKFISSNRVTVFSSDRTDFVGLREVSMSADQFGPDHYLNVDIRAAIGKEDRSDVPAQISFRASDGSSVVLYGTGKGLLTGTSSRNVHLLRLAFPCTEEQALSLRTKQFVALGLIYGSRNWKVDLNRQSSENINKILSLN